MTNLDNMSADELNAQLENDIQALNGGTNPSQEDTSQEETLSEEETTTPEEQEEVEEETQEENTKEPKTEKKIKKLLSQRNSERTEKQELADRVKEMENKLADTEFYKDNQDALNYKDQISELVEQRDLTRDEAYLLIAGKEVLEKQKKQSANKTAMIGNTPNSNKNGVNPKDMNMKDLDSLVNNMYSAGKINI